MGSFKSVRAVHRADPVGPAEYAVEDVLRSGWLTLGPVTAELERVLEDILSTDSAVATTSLGDALELILHSLSIQPGEEVVIAEGCPEACAAVAAHMGLVAAKAVGPECRVAFIASEDSELARAARDAGATVVAVAPEVRGFADADIVCVGLLEGGAAAAAVAGSAETTDRVRLLRSHAMTAGTWARHTGSAISYDVVGLGFNHRIDEPRSALALVELGRPLPKRDDAGATFDIPLTDVKLSESDIAAVLGELPGWALGGPRADQLETDFAEWSGAPHAVAVSSGSAALELSLRAAGIGPGDEVLVPALTFVATAAAVRHCGATPVICDVISPSNPLLDPQDAERRITKRTRAVIPVHLFGATADIDAVSELADRHSLLVIEDAAQAVGARLAGGRLAGTGGFAGCFSLFSKKQLTCGEGGLITCADAEVAATLRRLRDEGPGYRLGEPAAALALGRLKRLRADLWSRDASVRHYRSLLAGVGGVVPVFDDEAAARSSHFAFSVLVADLSTRDRVREQLAAAGVQTTWYPALPSFTEYAPGGERPLARAAAERHFALPLSSSTTRAAVEQVVAALEAALAGAPAV